MNGPYAATGHYRATDIGDTGQPIRHAVVDPRGVIHSDHLPTFNHAMQLAADLERGIHYMERAA